MGLRTVTDNAPTTRETADHAELTRKFEALAVDAAAARNLDGAESMMVSIQTIYDLITSRNALLSEIAALRGRENEMIATHAVAVVRIERQRDEFRKALERIAYTPDGEDGMSLKECVDLARQAIANQGAD